MSIVTYMRCYILWKRLLLNSPKLKCLRMFSNTTTVTYLVVCKVLSDVFHHFHEKEFAAWFFAWWVYLILFSMFMFNYSTDWRKANYFYGTIIILCLIFFCSIEHLTWFHFNFTLWQSTIIFIFLFVNVWFSFITTLYLVYI